MGNNITDIKQLLNDETDEKHFPSEVLPSLKGNGTASLFRNIDQLKEFNPSLINMTTHHSEFMYHEHEDGLSERQRIRHRPGAVAIAAAIQQRYGIPVTPYVICSGVTKEDIEYELLDLQFLGIKNLMLLRGDKAREDRFFTSTEGGHSHTTELIEQVNSFNEGVFIDGSTMKHPGGPFVYGVACYPEEHEEAPDLEQDLRYLEMKQDLSATFAVTQFFYDNEKFYNFVGQARKTGVTIPIIPGIKSFAKLSQLNAVPKTSHCDIPGELAGLALLCKSDEEARLSGVEWAARQVKDLYAYGFNNVHFYTVSAMSSVHEVMKRLVETGLLQQNNK